MSIDRWRQPLEVGKGRGVSVTDPGIELRQLAGEFKPALQRFFSRRVKDPAEVEDLVHDTFVRLLRQQHHVDVELARGYVFQTANSVMVDWLRRKQAREAYLDQLHGEETDSVSSPDRVLAAHEDLKRVSAALQELPPRVRGIFLLRRMEGMKYEEIAIKLGLSLSTVEKLMRKALVHLASRVQEE